jgi:hypothetical protein
MYVNSVNINLRVKTPLLLKLLEKSKDCAPDSRHVVHNDLCLIRMWQRCLCDTSKYIFIWKKTSSGENEMFWPEFSAFFAHFKAKNYKIFKFLKANLINKQQFEVQKMLLICQSFRRKYFLNQNIRFGLISPSWNWWADESKLGENGSLRFFQVLYNFKPNYCWNHSFFSAQKGVLLIFLS